MGAAKSLLGAVDSDLSSDAEKAKAVFLKLGKMKGLTPGQLLIQQGIPLSHMYMVMHGELAIMRLGEDGLEEQELGRCGAGEVLGELSFLLGTSPVVSVKVPDGGKDVTVIEVELSRALDALQKQPVLVTIVFRLLATLLAERVAQSSEQRKLHMLQLSQQMSSGSAPHRAAELTGREPPSAELFGLEPNARLLDVMAVTCRTHVAEPRTDEEEQLGSAGGAEMHGTMCVFETALCLELRLFGHTSHRAIPYSEILFCRQADGAASDSGDGGERPMPMLEVSCQGGLTLLIGLAPDRFLPAAREIERLRLDAIDTSSLYRVQSAPKSFAPAPPARAAAAASASVDEPRPAGGAAHGGVDADLQPDAVANLPQIYASYLSRQDETAGVAAAVADGPSVAKIMGRLTADEFATLMRGAEHRRCPRGHAIVQEGEVNQALFQLTSGCANVELHIEGRPQAVRLAASRGLDLPWPWPGPARAAACRA